MVQPNYYAVIPASVRYSSVLSANSKLLYGEITALSSKEGHCWASNDYFANLYGVGAKTASEWVGELRDAGFITYTVENNNTRRIFMVGGYPKKTVGVPEKDGGGYPKKTDIVLQESITTKGESKIRIVYGDEDKPRKPQKYPHSKEVFSWFPKPEPSWSLNTTELSHAELLWERGEAEVKKRLKYVANHADEDFIPKITKPSELERKWNDLFTYAKRNG